MTKICAGKRNTDCVYRIKDAFGPCSIPPTLIFSAVTWLGSARTQPTQPRFPSGWVESTRVQARDPARKLLTRLDFRLGVGEGLNRTINFFKDRSWSTSSTTCKIRVFFLSFVCENKDKSLHFFLLTKTNLFISRN